LDFIDFSQSKIVLSAKIDYKLEEEKEIENEVNEIKKVLQKEIEKEQEERVGIIAKAIARAKIKDTKSKMIYTIKGVIENELPNEFDKAKELSFHTKILEIREGSIDVVFSINDLIIPISLVATYEGISSFKSFYESIELICVKCKNLLNNALKKMGVTSIEEVKPKEIIYVDGKELITCNCERLCAELSQCAGTLETSLVTNGAILGKDFTKLDCFKLATELMKNCHQFYHQP